MSTYIFYLIFRVRNSKYFYEYFEVGIILLDIKLTFKHLENRSCVQVQGIKKIILLFFHTFYLN